MDELHLLVPDNPDQTTIKSLPEETVPAGEPAVDPGIPEPMELPDASAGVTISGPPEAETPLHAASAVFAAGPVKPFAIALTLRSSGKPNHFIPAATVEISQTLRTSGLLASLPAEEVKTLLALLTFLSPNGDIHPTAGEVAQSLNISEGKARERLSRLVRFRWQSRPLASTLWRETGLDGYTLSPDIVSYREADAKQRPTPTAPFRAAGREAVIATSRAKYARPRAEVEREIAMLNGWPLPDTGEDPATVSPGEYLRQRLLRLGVTAEQAGILLETFPHEDIELQIAWLPYRGAKNPASYLVAAITGQYAEPELLKMRWELEPQPGRDITVDPSSREEP